MAKHKNTHKEEDTIQNLKKIASQKKKQSFKHMPKEPVIIAFESVEKEHYPRGPLWYLGLFILMTLAALYGLYTESWTTVIVFILIPVAVILYGNAPIKTHEIFITEKGIYTDTELIEYKDIENFWVFDEHLIKKMGFREKGVLQKEHDIILHDVDPELLQKVLVHYLTQDVHKKEGAVSHLTRIFRL